MRRSVFIFSCFALLFLGLASVLGCGYGNASGIGPPSKVVLSPSPVSMNVGGVQQMSAVVEDANGNIISGETFLFSTSDATKVTTSNGGFLCAGVWDGTFIHCTPGPNPTGSATISVKSSSGLSGSVTVYIHQKADSVIVGLVGSSIDCTTIPPALPPSCVSAGATAPNNTASYTAIACSNDPNVCSTLAASPPCQLPANTLGAFGFEISNSTVATAAADTTNPNTVFVVTAKQPGLELVTASLSSTSSLPASFQTCAPQSIFIHVLNQPAQTTVSVAPAGTATLTADVLDTNGLAIPNLILQWSSTNPPAATVNTGGGVTGVAVGNANVIAGCAPPACNFGTTHAIYSNPVNVTVTGTANTTTVYVTSTDPGTASLIPIDTSTNTAGTAIPFPAGFSNPNSMMMTTNGGKVFIGTSTGVIAYDPVAATFSSTTLAKGKVIGVGNADGAAVIADTTPGVNAVYTWIAGATSVATYSIPGATAGVFTPDDARLFVSATSGGIGHVYEIANNVFLNKTASGPASDITMLPNGSFAYVADPGMEFYSSCVNDLGGDVGISPVLVRAAGKSVAAPNNQQMQVLAVVPPQIEQVDVLPTATPSGTSCPPAPTNTVGAYTFPGVAAFTPVQLVVSPDNSKAVVLASDVNKVLEYTIGADAASGSTPTPITLAGAATGSFSGGITLDGTKAYVGVSGVNEVQAVDLVGGTVLKEIPVSLTPQLVVVRPH